MEVSKVDMLDGSQGHNELTWWMVDKAVVEDCHHTGLSRP